VFFLACGQSPVSKLELERESAILSAPDTAAGDIYGGAVAISGEFSIVAAEWDDDHGMNSGAAWVFRLKSGEWRRAQKLVAPDAAQGDNFARAVALRGRTAVIGAHWDDTAAGANAGSAYVYRFDGESWKFESKLVARNGAGGDAMGNAVAVDGDWIAVGAWRKDDRGKDSGAVHMFHRSDGRWIEMQTLTASDAAASDEFGQSISLSTDTLVIGSWKSDAAGEDSGAAYVYRRSGQSWVPEQKLVAADLAADDRFGVCASVDGNLVLVGAYGSEAGGPDAGAGYVFRHDGSRWVEEQKLVPRTPSKNAWVGYAVAIQENVAVLSSHKVFAKSAGPPGSAYVFEYEGGRWTQSLELAPSDGHPGDVFGFHLALDDRRVVAGAWRHNHAGKNSGRAYIFDLR